MPSRICRQPGCGKSTTNAYCDDHSTAARDRERYRRAGKFRKLYDSAQWRKRTRLRILVRDPMCKIATLCGGNAPSTDVDHVIRAEIYVAQHGNDWRYFFDEKNLQGSCHADHARKTQLEQG